MPVPVGLPANVETEKLVWNRWKTPNFTIVSLDQQQGDYLYRNLENIRKWILNRWGLEDAPFPVECRVVCVPTKTLMKRLFFLDRSHYEVKKEMIVIWLLMEGKPTEAIPVAITPVCLKEYEISAKVKLPFWMHRGAAVLNGSFSQVRSEIGLLQPHIKGDSRMYFTKSLLTMTEEQWVEQGEERRVIYDSEAAVFCLLVRKEFGQNKFMELVKSQYPDGIVKVLGLQGYDELDATFKRYMDVLSSDVISRKAPDSYLQITKE
jgi:hypothetical protein